MTNGSPKQEYFVKSSSASLDCISELKTRGIKYSNVETWLLFVPSLSKFLATHAPGSGSLIPVLPLLIYQHNTTSEVMFSDKFLMSGVLSTNLMLTGLLVLFSTFPSF